MELQPHPHCVALGISEIQSSTRYAIPYSPFSHRSLGLVLGPPWVAGEEKPIDRSSGRRGKPDYPGLRVEITPEATKGRS
jgi:hypothetical protein